MTVKMYHSTCKFALKPVPVPDGATITELKILSDSGDYLGKVMYCPIMEQWHLCSSPVVSMTLGFIAQVFEQLQHDIVEQLAQNTEKRVATSNAILRARQKRERGYFVDPGVF